MGGKSSTLTGGVQHKGNVSLQTRQQREYLKRELQNMGGISNKTLRSFLKEPNMMDLLENNMLGRYMNPAEQTYRDLARPQDTQAAFQKSIVDPLMQQYTQRVLPSIYNQLGDLNASASSSINQQLGQSARDLTTQMGQMYMPFLQNQQQQQLQAAHGLTTMTNPLMDYYNQGQANRFNTLNLLSSAAGHQVMQPMIHQKTGILGSLIQGGSQIGAAYAGAQAAAPAAAAASSEKVKENIRDYEGGLDKVNNLQVKQYDYIPSLGGARDKVGLIAEKVPSEIQADVNGVLGVDVYGLVSLLVNAVKELSNKVDKLEEKICQAH